MVASARSDVVEKALLARRCVGVCWWHDFAQESQALRQGALRVLDLVRNGAPKSQLRAFEAQLAENENRTDVQDGVEARLLEHPDGDGEERFVLCRSYARAAKERAMLDRQMTRLSEEFVKIDRSLRRRPELDPGTAPARTPSKPRFGSRSASTSWWPVSRRFTESLNVWGEFCRS